MKQTIYGMYHAKKNAEGKIINDSLIALGSIQELCKQTGFARSAIFKWLETPPEGVEVVRLFKEVR